MNNHIQPALPILLPDRVWELLGVQITVILSCFLLWFFAVGSVELRILLVLGGWLLGMYLAAGHPLRRPCPLNP